MAIAPKHKQPKHSHTRQSEAGFTLVEVLCVVALLGLTTGLVALNLPRPAPSAQVEMQAVVTTFNLASRNSVIDGKARAFDVNSAGLELFQYDGEWVSETTRDFNNVSKIVLEVEGERIDLRERERSKKDLPPLIHLDATGNVTPFTLSVSGRDLDFVLAPNIRGKVEMVIEP